MPTPVRRSAILSDRDFVGSRICRFHQNVFRAPTASTGVFRRPYRLHLAFFVRLPPSSGEFFAPTASTVSFRANTSRKNTPVDPRKADPRKPTEEPPPPPLRKRCRPRTPARPADAGPSRTGRRHWVMAVTVSRQCRRPQRCRRERQPTPGRPGRQPWAGPGEHCRAVLPALPLGASILAA